MCITDEDWEEYESNFNNMPDDKVIASVELQRVFSEYLVSHGYTP